MHYEKLWEFLYVLYILNYIWYVQHLNIPLYNDNDLNDTKFFIFQIFICKFFCENIINFCIVYIIPAAVLLINSFLFFSKLTIFITCFLKDSKIFSFKNIFIQSLHNAFFPLLLNNEAADIEKPNGIFLHFFCRWISGLLLHPSIFTIIHSRLA